LLRTAVTAGDIVVSLRAADAQGRPTGEDLAVGYIAANSVTQSWTHAWYVINFSTPYEIYAGQAYAIVIRAAGAAADTPVYYWLDTAGTYAGGWVTASNDGGVTWMDISLKAWDAVFEEWGISQ
jgi:hypothetical protein